MKASRPTSSVNAERALVMMLRSGGVVVLDVEHIEEKRDRRKAEARTRSWRQTAPNGKCSSVKLRWPSLEVALATAGLHAAPMS